MLAGIVPTPLEASVDIAVMLTIQRFFFGSFIGFRIRHVRYRIALAQPSAQVNLSAPLATKWFRRACLRLELGFANGTTHC